MVKDESKKGANLIVPVSGLFLSYIQENKNR